MNLPIYDNDTPDATAAIQNAINQHIFWTNRKAFGPAYEESERKRNAEIFAKEHPSFFIRTNAGLIEICTHYKETKRDLIYQFRVFNNNKLADINLLKHLLNERFKKL
jgi:hypothetical protein